MHLHHTENVRQGSNRNMQLTTISLNMLLEVMLQQFFRHSQSMTSECTAKALLISRLALEPWRQQMHCNGGRNSNL